MFDIRITIGSIDYEKTIATLFPAALQKCREMEEPGLILRLFLELGEDALPVLMGFLEKLSENARQELLCRFMNGYRMTLTEKVNLYLQEDAWGRNFVIQSLYIEQTSEGLELMGEGVRINFHALLESEGVRSKIQGAASVIQGFGGFGKTIAHHAGMALKVAAEAALEETEKLGLKLLQREDVREKLKGLAQDALEKRELALELKALSFVPVPDADIVSDAGGSPDAIVFSAELEEELIKALAGCIRGTVCKKNR